MVCLLFPRAISSEGIVSFFLSLFHPGLYGPADTSLRLLLNPIDIPFYLRRNRSGSKVQTGAGPTIIEAYQPQGVIFEATIEKTLQKYVKKILA